MTTRRPATSRFSRYALAAATAASGVAALADPSTARADFSGSYTVNPPANGSYGTAGLYGSWNAVFSGVAATSETINTMNAPVMLSLSDTASFNSSGTAFLTFSTSIAGDGPLSFSYTAAANGGFQHTLEYILNGVETALPVGSGTVTIPSVGSANSFGFQIGSSYGGSTSLTISNFAAPVPEPTVNALIAAGAIGLLGLRESRRRRAAAAMLAVA